MINTNRLVINQLLLDYNNLVESIILNYTGQTLMNLLIDVHTNH